MSWRKTDPFFFPPEKINRERKIIGLEKIETDILETEVIDGGALIINNKNMMITSNEMRIETDKNSLVIPNSGPIQVSSLAYKYSKIDLDNVNALEINVESYGNTQHFILASREKMIPELSVKIMPYAGELLGENLIKIYFYLDVNAENFAPFIVKMMNQDLCIKLNSIHSSFSLIWLPSKRWNIGELGFKTTVIDS